MGFTKILLSVLFLCREVKPNQEVMDRISNVLRVEARYCVEKEGLAWELEDEISHFWEDTFHPDTAVACMFECILRRLKIINFSGGISPPRMSFFFLRLCGADDETMKRVAITMANDCPGTAVGCDGARAYIMCFREQYFNREKVTVGDSFTLRGVNGFGVLPYVVQ
ncbi:uncharacterized protein isoform X1 [Choristoneura fumiferana]|uniref:uncharacterized protein isoform X1 n=1 Tax=Choristoneura fumiferana TaxID=7141 RepID=UPI003D1591FD